MKTAKRLALLFVLTFAALLCGCESGEVQRRVVIHAMGIDPHEKGYEVSYQIFSGGEADSGPIDASESTVVTLLAQGRTLFEAEESLRLQTGKEVFLGDAELIVISEDLKDADLVEFLQYFRRADLYLGVNVVFCRGSAADAIGTKLEQGSATAILLRGVVEQAIKSGRAFSSRIMELSNAIEHDGEAAAIPILSLEKGEKTEDDKSISDLTIGVFGAQVVSPDGAVGELDENAAMGLRLLRADARQLSLEVAVSGGTAAVVIDNMKIKRKISVSGGVPYIRLNIRGRYDIRSSPTGVDEEEIKQAAQMQLLALCEAASKAVRDGGVDLIQLQKLLMKYETKYAESLNGDYSEAVKQTVYSVSTSLSKY